MTGDLDKLLRPHLRDMKPYVPISLPGAIEGDGVRPDGSVIKLDGNENVYGCSPKVREALGDLANHHIYPDADQRDLRDALGSYTSVGAEHIVAGAGSDELIELLLRMLAGPGDSIATVTPTFGVYASAASIVGAEVISVPRRDDFSVDVEALVGKSEPHTKAVFVATPNNPTGTVTPRNDLEQLISSEMLIVVDEAYYEFCGDSVADLVPHYDNLVVLRTFSKWAGLAGLRIGYGIFPPRLADLLMATKPPYNVNVAAEVAAIASLNDIDYLMGNVQKLIVERDRLEIMLMNLDFVEVIPSEGNFLLCRMIDRDARMIQQDLRTKGIFIRHFDTPSIEDCVRISIGRPADTDALIWALRAYEGVY